ncbi:SDR family oxidoreductase [Salinicoccus sp. ID82-1]|uniref:SDR family oxidoreductase n=1 Tax=Salinicoccus sp. ID82-1 TaxID=2820269 RepID=UPI001F15C888|nr:SDR family oxidoreductase [Salinicoccus sp. ID82-1]MCG1009639.1 SDR family oxidoreductase [Salinicoccus sp. ID82-1]
MNVLVIGANGQIGRIVVDKLKESEHEPIAMVRKEAQAEAFQNKDVKTVLGDLEKDFSHAFEGVDAVVFTAGSGAHTGADKTILIDQEGAMESIDLAEKHGVEHFVMVSGMGVENPRAVEGKMRPYLHAKHRADQYLEQSGVPYTILRPGRLTDDAGKGAVNFYEYQGDVEYGEVPREDVASVLMEIINTKAENKLYYLIGGDTPVTQIL